MKNRILYFCIALSLSTVACSPMEMGKTIWGSSTRALEEARVDAIKKTYSCDFDACFDAIVSLDRKNNLEKPLNQTFEIFLQDRIQSHIVVMGIAGQVDTTEVGIFFSRESPQAYTIEISSLSTPAKEKVAKLVFNELDKHFSEKTRME